MYSLLQILMQWERGPAVDVETFTWRALFLFWSAENGRFLDSQVGRTGVLDFFLPVGHVWLARR